MIEAIRLKVKVLGDSVGGCDAADVLHYDRPGAPGISTHPCEHCKCCSCQRVCTRCRSNCSPSDSYFIPVVGCPEFVDMRMAKPVRYLYRSEYGREFKIHLPGAR
jgi:hypothetical protein